MHVHICMNTHAHGVCIRYVPVCLHMNTCAQTQRGTLPVQRSVFKSRAVLGSGLPCIEGVTGKLTAESSSRGMEGFWCVPARLAAAALPPGVCAGSSSWGMNLPRASRGSGLALAVLCIRTRGGASAAAWDRRGRDRGRQLLAEELSCALLRNQSRFPGVSHNSSALGQVVRQCH